MMNETQMRRAKVVKEMMATDGFKDAMEIFRASLVDNLMKTTLPESILRAHGAIRAHDEMILSMAVMVNNYNYELKVTDAARE